MRTLVEAARPLRVVCHKAFDETPDAKAALDALMELGVDEVLTSGHAKTAIEGAAEIAEYVKRGEGKIKIMAGGTVRAENVQQLILQSGVSQVHSRATDL
jgi:copper homeostasis protein